MSGKEKLQCIHCYQGGGLNHRTGARDQATQDPHRDTNFRYSDERGYRSRDFLSQNCSDDHAVTWDQIENLEYETENKPHGGRSDADEDIGIQGDGKRFVLDGLSVGFF